MLHRLRTFLARLDFIRDTLRLAPAARWLSVACVAVFIVQTVTRHFDLVDGLPFGYMIRLCFGLCPKLLACGFVWQVFTYMFLHGNLLHLLLNTMTVLLFGSGLEAEIGSSRFLRVFVLGGVVGGLAWAGLDMGVVRLWNSGAGGAWMHALLEQAMARRVVSPDGLATCIGASGAVCSLIGACAALFPHREIVLFVGWPVALKARTLAIMLGVGNVAFAVYGVGNVAYLTHLFGGVAGYFYGLRLVHAGWGDEPPSNARRGLRVV